ARVGQDVALGVDGYEGRDVRKVEGGLDAQQRGEALVAREAGARREEALHRGLLLRARRLRAGPDLRLERAQRLRGRAGRIAAAAKRLEDRVDRAGRGEVAQVLRQRLRQEAERLELRIVLRVRRE